jgi:hypothetical protein
MLKLASAAFGEALPNPRTPVAERKPRRLGGLLKRT